MISPIPTAFDFPSAFPSVIHLLQRAGFHFPFLISGHTQRSRGDTERSRNGSEAGGFVLSRTDEGGIGFYSSLYSCLHFGSASLLALHGGLGCSFFFLFLNLSTLLL